MAERVIPLVDLRSKLLQPTIPVTAHPATGQLHDTLARPLRDLRISVTDRCNFRCSYCMPKDVFDKNYRYLAHGDLLRFEEITRLARLFMAHGVHKIRLTGGEPLLRKGLENLVAQLAALRTAEGRVPDLTLTTNGSLLARKARALKDAGLQRVTVSLDSLDDAVFRRMNDMDFPVAEVLAGIEAAQAAGLQHRLPGFSAANTTTFGAGQLIGEAAGFMGVQLGQAAAQRRKLVQKCIIIQRRKRAFGSLQHGAVRLRVLFQLR